MLEFDTRITVAGKEKVCYNGSVILDIKLGL